MIGNIVGVMAEQAAGTRERLVEAAAAVIEEGGESAIRLRDIATKVGVAEPSIYHFFKNRDDLVAAAQEHRFVRQQAQIRRFFAERVGAARTRADFLDVVRATVDDALALGDRVAVRRGRMNVLGSAQSRPALARRLAALHHEASQELAGPIRRAQQSGWIRADLDAEALASWTMSMANARIFIELDPDRIEGPFGQHWNAIAVEAVLAVIGAPSPAVLDQVAMAATTPTD